MTSYIRSIEVIGWWKESVILSSVSWGMALFCDSMRCDCSFSLKVIDSAFYHILYSICCLSWRSLLASNQAWFHFPWMHRILISEHHPIDDPTVAQRELDPY